MIGTQISNEPNTTDANIGKSLRRRVEIRKAELESALGRASTDKRVRGELEIALSELDGLLSGDLDHIPKVVAAELSTWLEANKHIDEHHPMARSSPPSASTPSSQAPIEKEHARDKILKLLSETELAQVSTVDEAVGLVPGDEYIDLEHLEDGVHKAPPAAAAAPRMLPRRAVSDDTWRKILAVLG